jgi:hypothetical protein
MNVLPPKIKKALCGAVILGLLWSGCAKLWGGDWIDEIEQVRHVLKKSSNPTIYIERYKGSTSWFYTGEISIHQEQDFLIFAKEIEFKKINCDMQSKYLSSIETNTLLKNKFDPMDLPCKKESANSKNELFFQNFIVYERVRSGGDGKFYWIYFIFDKKMQKTYFFSRVPHVFL